jgi:biopolymer transport protein ExbD
VPKLKRKDEEEIILNLIPIMNLFTALIPFLLLSAAFFHMSVIQITVPVASTETGETDIAKEEDKITLQLDITSEAFNLQAASDTLDPSVVSRLKDKIPRVKSGNEEAEKAMLKQITDAAYKIKGKYTASDTVIITPDAAIPYEDVVAAMDAVREITIERGRMKSQVSLFPRVVLSSRLK